MLFTRSGAQVGKTAVVHQRWMIRRDMPEVLAIESALPEPWSEEDFLRLLRHRNCIGMVSEFEDRVVGFDIYELHRGLIRILRLAVHPEFRRRGVGRQMIAKLVGKLSARRHNRLEFDVPETDLDVQLLLKSCGFRATQIIESRDRSVGDTYKMVYEIN